MDTQEDITETRLSAHPTPKEMFAACASHLVAVAERILKPEYVFLFLALSLGSILAVLSPAGMGADEPSHVNRVIQLAHRQITPVFIRYADDYPQTTEEERAQAALYGGDVDANLNWVVTINFLQTQPTPYIQSYAFPPWTDENSASDFAYGEGGLEQAIFSNSAVNAPFVYLPFLVGFVVARILRLSCYWLIICMRLFGVFAYATIGFVAIRRIPFGRWPLAFFLASPGVIANMSYVSADTMTVALCALLLSEVLHLCHDAPKSAMGWIPLCLACVFLPLAKTVYTPLLGLLILIPIANPKMRTTSCIGALLLIFVTSIGALALWFSKIGGINTGAMYKPGVDTGAQLQFVLADPVRFFSMISKQFIGADIFQIDVLDFLVHIRTQSDYQLLRIPCTLILFLMFLPQDSRDLIPQWYAKTLPWLLFGFFVAGALIVILTYLALYLSFSRVGLDYVAGVQSRYFIPLTLMIIICVSLFSTQLRQSRIKQPAKRDHSSTKALVVRAGTLVIVVCAILLAEASVIHMLHLRIFA